MADQPAYLPPLTDLESKALELLISSDRPLRDTANSLGISADALLDLIESPSLKPYLAVATWATQQSQFFAAAKHHRENLDNLRELASDRTADPALRLRACLTIFRGVPPAPRLDPPLRPLPPVTRTPTQPEQVATRRHAAPPPERLSAAATADSPKSSAAQSPILNLNRKAAALHRSLNPPATEQSVAPSPAPSPSTPHSGQEGVQREPDVQDNPARTNAQPSRHRPPDHQPMSEEASHPSRPPRACAPEPCARPP